MMRVFEGRRIIYSGSSSQYGRPDLNGDIAWSLYGACKLMFETIARAYCAEKGVSFVSARYSTIYGPGDTKKDAAIPSVIQTLLRHEKFRCEFPDNMWDFIYVNDAAEAMVRLISSELEGVLDIGTGLAISMRTAFQIIAETVGCPQCLEFNEDSLSKVNLTANISRMEKELGYTCPTSFTQGIAETVNWWRQRIDGGSL